MLMTCLYVQYFLSLQLSVFLAYPSGPNIKNVEDNLVYKLVKGTESTIKCSGINGFPQPKVTWLNG